MVIWEYTVDTIFSNVAEIQKHLAARGADGWELVNFKMIGGGNFMFVFKRMK